MKMRKFYETDMYEPVKILFEGMGYKINAEVKGCDVTAYKDGEIAVIELKTSFNLKLLYQGMERLKLTERVFLAVPRPAKSGSKESRAMLQIVKRLGFGMIFVALDSGVKEAGIVFWPGEQSVPVKKNTRKAQAVVSEINRRKLETNKGGSRGVKLNTAYRERCVKIACIIEQRGAQTARVLMRDYGCEKDTYAIISKGPYGWFMKIDKGLYDLSRAGRDFLEGDEFRTQVDYYRMLYKI